MNKIWNCRINEYQDSDAPTYNELETTDNDEASDDVICDNCIHDRFYTYCVLPEDRLCVDHRYYKPKTEDKNSDISDNEEEVEINTIDSSIYFEIGDLFGKLQGLFNKLGREVERYGE